MSHKTIVVIGAGPGIGMAVARQWGREGCSVALVARQAERLEGFVNELIVEGVDAAAYPTDVSDRDTLRTTLAAVKARFGSIDVVYFGPPASSGTMVAPRDFNVANATTMLDQVVLGAVTAVEFVLPDMIERGDGALLFCVPMSAIEPVLFSANYAMACAAVRNYAQSLYVDLAVDGIYSGVATIAGIIVEGDTERLKSLAAAARRPGDRAWDEYRAFHEDLAAHITSAQVADSLWDLASKRDRGEEILGNPAICTRLREQALAGVAVS